MERGEVDDNGDYGTQPFAEEVHHYVAQHMDRIAAAREEACELAIQSGRYGVLETRWEDGSVTLELSSSVPYGEIHVRQK